MYRRHFLKLIAFLIGLAPTQTISQDVEFLGSFHWDEPGIGGMSGIEVAPNGSDFWAINDRGSVIRGSLDRDDTGRVVEREHLVAVEHAGVGEVDVAGTVWT